MLIRTVEQCVNHYHTLIFAGSVDNFAGDVDNFDVTTIATDSPMGYVLEMNLE